MTDLPGVPPPPDDPGVVQRPSSVDNSFWAGVASPVIGLLAAALELFGVFGSAGSEAFLAQLRRQTATQGGGPAFAPEQMAAVYRIALVVGLVFLVVLAALWIMFLLFMRGGRNWARVVVTVVGALWLVTGPSLRLLGQDAELTAGASQFVLAQIPGLPFLLVFFAAKQFLQARGSVLPAMWVTLLGNALNVLLNWMLIFGRGGLPALGIVGSGLATSLTHAFLALALLGWMRFRREPADWRGAWQRGFGFSSASMAASESEFSMSSSS